MFAITTEQKAYTTYILRDDDAQAEIEIVPERGAIVTRWRIQDQDILYLDQERFAHPELSVRGGIPILFPICGNLPNNIFYWQDQNYELKQHGFARDLPWAISGQSTEGCASLTLELSSNDLTRSRYPFDFCLRFTYQLQGQSLRIHQQILNRSPEPMPFSLGFHPYFLTPDKSQLSFQIPASEYLDQKIGAVQGFNGNFDWKLPEIDVAFLGVDRHTASFSDHHQNQAIALHYSHLFSTVVFWTIAGKDYICLEPWSAPRNALNTGDRLTVLVPNEQCEALLEMSVARLS